MELFHLEPVKTPFSLLTSIEARVKCVRHHLFYNININTYVYDTTLA